MRAGSLFTGYGGLDMAATAVLGAEPVWFVENDPAASALLAYHYPHVPNHSDIARVGLPYSDEQWDAMKKRAEADDDFELLMPDWTQVEPVDLLAGGFPCQDISNAGQRAGIEGTRSGLWSHYANAIRLLRPRYVLIENVGALVVRGLDRVLADLAALGFDAEWTVVPASAVGAPHKRERVFIAAVAQDTDRAVGGERGLAAPGQAESGRARADTGGRDRTPAAHPEVERRHTRGLPLGEGSGDGRHEGRPEPARQLGGPDAAKRGAVDWGQYEPAIRRWERILGRPAPVPTVTGTRGGRVLNPALPEWMMGLPDGWITQVPGLTRSQQLKLAGNGVVPQQGIAAFRYLLPLLAAQLAAA